jgi:hypothetical protein
MLARYRRERRHYGRRANSRRVSQFLGEPAPRLLDIFRLCLLGLGVPLRHFSFQLHNSLIEPI